METKQQKKKKNNNNKKKMPRTFTNRPMGVADVKELQKRAKAARLRGDRPTSLRLLQQATQVHFNHM